MSDCSVCANICRNLHITDCQWFVADESLLAEKDYREECRVRSEMDEITRKEYSDNGDDVY